MAPPQQSKPAVKPAVTFRSKPRKGEVKVSVINICCPYSLDILRPNPQINSCVPTHRPQAPVSHVRRNLAVSKEPHTATTTLQTGSCLNRDGICRTGSSTHHLIGHSPQLRPRCSAGVSDSALKECLIIRPLHNQIQKTPDGPAAL